MSNIEELGPRPTAALAKAVDLHQAGKLDLAATAYNVVLDMGAEAGTARAAALTNLGQLERARGRGDRALSCYEEAIGLPGAGYELWFNLANLYLERNQTSDALTCMRVAVLAAPNQPNVLAQLATILCQPQTRGRRGQEDTADAWLRRSLRVSWSQPLVHMALGNLMRQRGRLHDALDRHKVALRLAPNLWEVRYNLALTLAELEDFRGAAEQISKAVLLTRRPAHLLETFASFLLLRRAFSLAHVYACKSLVLTPDASDAVLCMAHCEASAAEGTASRRFRHASVVAANDPTGLSRLATAEWECGREAAAAITLGRVVEILPGNTEGRLNLARALHRLWRPGPALIEARRAVLLAPDHAEGWSLLGVILSKWARIDEALAAHDTAGRIAPDNLSYVSSQAFTSLYSDTLSAAGKADLHRRLAERIEHAADGSHSHQPTDPSLQKSRLAHPPIRGRAKLRVGYLSPDLAGRHPVAVLASPLFQLYDTDRFELVAYSGHARPDATSSLIRAQCAVWYDTEGWSDGRLEATIRADRIDVLVDLAGHTAGNRLGVLARRPSPVQASFVGYPHSSGLTSIDTLIADPIVCPPELLQHCSETVALLPRCLFCLDPNWSAIEVDPAPGERRAATGSPAVFGSFNNLPKLSPRTLDLWAAVLHDQDASRLRVRAPSLGDPDVRADLRRRFVDRGIDPDRLDLLGPCGLDDLLRDYAEVDVALDPLRFNGGMTTLQALWMGVPVVSLAGDTMCSRMGASILATAGLDDLVVSSEDDYIAQARALAADRNRLSALRQTLRARMAASPLCDVRSYTRDVESLYISLA